MYIESLNDYTNVRDLFDKNNITPNIFTKKIIMKLEILNRLFDYIESKGLTQAEFGEKLMLSRAAVSAWRNGHSAPSGDRIIDILLTYEDLDANWLIRGKGSQNVTLNNKMSGKHITNQQGSNLHYNDATMWKEMYEMTLQLLKEKEETIKLLKSISNIS